MSINYKSYEFRVYEHISQLDKLLHTGIGPDEVERWRSEVEELRGDFETKHFRVAVVGEFNRGKTTFVNALLGKEILPADYLPTTAAINRITYSDSPSAYIVMKDGRRQSVEIAELAEYVTKLTAAATEKASQIREAVVEYPSLFCRNGVDLIDTPGMNDEDAMNQVTISRLEGIDLAIVAIDASMPFSMTECAFTVQLLESPHVCQIIIVATKIDMIRERERQKLIDYMVERVREDVRTRLEKLHAPDSEVMKKYHDIFDEPCVFAVSAADALDALSCNNMELFEESGLLRLNNELPQIIMRSQNNSIILNTERTINSIIQKYREHIRDSQRNRQLLPSSLDKMKQNFAQVSYETTSDFFEFPDKELSVFLREIDQEQTEIRKYFIHALAKMKVLSMEELRGVFSPVIKERFQILNKKFPAKERIWKADYVKDRLNPIRDDLYRKWKTLLQPFPGLHEKMMSGLDSLKECFELMKPGTQEESFYWVQSPIPPESALIPDWNVMPYVDSVIQYNLMDYRRRCMEQIKDIFLRSQRRLDERVRILVKELFALTASYSRQEEEGRREEEHALLEKLSALEKESRDLTDKFLKEMEVQG